MITAMAAGVAVLQSVQNNPAIHQDFYALGTRRHFLAIKRPKTCGSPLTSSSVQNQNYWSDNFSGPHALLLRVLGQLP
jgi:hypothetical protein